MTTVDEIQGMVPEINFLKYFEGIAPPDFSINGRKIQVQDMPYFRGLSKIINSTSKDTLNDFFQWRLIQRWTEGLHEDYWGPLQRNNDYFTKKEKVGLLYG